MKTYPKKVQEKLDILTKYTENEKLIEFNICHLYKTKLAYPIGFYDSMEFTLMLYNTQKMEKRILYKKDGIRFYSTNPPKIKGIGIYADGSTYIDFSNNLHTFIDTQCVYISPKI